MFPEIRISDSIVIPTYLLYQSLLYCFLLFYVVRKVQFSVQSTRGNSKNKDLKSKKENLKTVLDLALILMVAGFIGGRFLHIIYEMPEYYLEDLSRIYQFWEGGFVFYGGFIFAFIGCAIYLWKRKLSFFWWADFYAPVLALGYGLGRISCFLAGCCYGRSCALPWAVKFPWDYHQVLRHPAQLYAVAWELAVFGLLISLPRWKRLKTGVLFSIWLVLHGLGRLLMEYYREDFRGDLLAGLSISSWVSLVVIITGIGILIRLNFFKALRREN